jgi:hypothetical protein
MAQEIHIERKYGTCIVTVHITDESVGVSTPFDDYMNLLFDEMGQVATVMSKEGLKKKMQLAAESLNLKLKSQVSPFANQVRR